MGPDHCCLGQLAKLEIRKVAITDRSGEFFLKRAWHLPDRTPELREHRSGSLVERHGV
jgi:hypothetical protein